MTPSAATSPSSPGSPPSQTSSSHAPVPRRVSPPSRLLCGPGPSNVHPDVLSAMALPLTGHLDPYFLAILDQINEMLRTVFVTQNLLTFPLSGTGSAGLEAALVNTLETGDTAVICVNGVFGERLCEVVKRCGARVERVEAPWGQPISPDDLARTMQRFPQARLVAAVHAETSTGVENNPAALGRVIREHAPDALFVLDAVTSLAGIPVNLDSCHVDICYSGTQKCLSVPPGLSPVSFSERAFARCQTRTTPTQSWYLDVSLIGRYLDASQRAYHHTAPISALFGLHEGLRRVLNEGLEARYRRHRAAGERLQQELKKRGYQLFAAEGARLPQLTSVLLPDGVDDAAVRNKLLHEQGIEIGGGLGAYAGKLWRIGLMGENATDEVVDRLLDALPS